MDANEDYLDSLLNSVLSQESGGGDSNAQQNNEAELKEINDLLKKSDQNQVPDAEMLAMLERAESEKTTEGSDNDVPDVFDIFSSESLEAEEDHTNADGAGAPMPDGVQSESREETYQNAFPDTEMAENTPIADGSLKEEQAYADRLQSEGDLSDSDMQSKEEDFLSLDSLQTEEEPVPMDANSGAEEDFLSLDSLQTEEESVPTDVDYDAGADFLSLDSLQTEEEPAPTDIDSGAGEDFLSLDSLQIGEESAPMDTDSANEEDFLSLDSLQIDEEPSMADRFSDSEELLSLAGMESGQDEEFDSSTEEDDAIQREIDELLGLAGGSEEENTQQINSGSEEHPSDVANDIADTSHKKEKKEKKKLFGKKKKKESAESEQTETENGGQPVEDRAAIGNTPEEEMTAEEVSASTQEMEASAIPSDGKQKKAKSRKEKGKKPKPTSENEQTEPGFFAKLLNGLFEEADEEEEQPQEMEVSDENREIMAMMENEKIDNKKPGSKKAKKGKKGKAGAKQEGDEEGDEEAPVDEKKAKKDKKKKEKKEKKEQKQKAKQEKEQEEKAVPAKKLPRGKVFSIFAFCLTLLAVIVILCFVLPQQHDLKTAREAYYDHDYLTAYQNMEGKDLNDSDYILYMRSKMILNMQGKLDNYLVYMGMDKEMAALNELMLAVHYYQSNRAAAEGYGALEEMNTVYDQVLSVLSQQYQLSETEAIDIFALDDLSYNERLYYIVYGTEFVAPNVPQSGTTGYTSSTETGSLDSEVFDDVLPEESEMIGDDQEQEIFNDVPVSGNDTESGGISTDWQINDENVAQDNGWEVVPDVSEGDALPSGTGAEDTPDAGGNDQPQNTPGESLSQGNGDVLYSGEVQNGNAVLQ